MVDRNDPRSPSLDDLIVILRATHEAVSGLVDVLLAVPASWLPDDQPLLLGRANERRRRTLRIAVARAEGLQ